MNVFDRLKAWLTGRGISEPLMLSGLYPFGGQPPRRGSRELVASYRTSPWLRAICDRIAGPVASNTWRLYAKTSSPGGRAIRSSVLQHGDRAARQRELRAAKLAGVLREIEEHPLLDLLARPNRLLTGRAARQVTQIHLDLKGESFWALERNAEGMPTGAWPMPPHWVTDTPGVKDPFFTVNFGGLKMTLPERDVLWMRQPDPSNPYGRGTGVAEALGDELETDDYVQKHLKAWFYNRAMPEFLVGLEGASPESVKLARAKWDEDHRGPQNTGRAHFHNGKMNAVRMDTTFRDNQMVEIRKLQRDFMVQTFSLPPECVGILTNSNRATISAAFAMLAEGVICPRLEFWRTELQHSLVPQYDDRLVLEYDSPIPEDREYTLKAAAIAPWAINQNEWRELMDRAPIPGGDSVFIAAPGTKPMGEGGPAADEALPAPEPVEPDEDDRAPRADPPWALALAK